MMNVKGNIYRETFEQVKVSEKTRMAVLAIPDGKKEGRPFGARRKFSMVMVCCLILVLITGTAVAVSSGGGLRSWFENEWKLSNGSEMSTDQLSNDDRQLIMLIDGELNPDVVEAVEGQIGTFRLTLTDLMEEPVKSDKKQMLQEGQWQFEFQIPLEAAGRVLTAQPADVELMTDNNEMVTCNISDLRVTAVDVKYTFTGHDDAHRDMPRIILKNGYEVGIGGGMGSVQDDGTWEMQYQLRMPVDIEQVRAVKFGTTEIPVY